jgi:NADPH:quinone reductase-like Zn-dependent oxidoreductase
MTVAPRRWRQVLARLFLLFLLLAGGLAVYLWVTGNRQDPIVTGEPHIRAVVYTRYGPPDVLEVREIAKPVPNDDQILVKVRAVAINPLDWHYMRGTPYVMRLDSGLRRPKAPRLGVDLAGVVEAAGRNVTQFKPGDEVFGVRTGALAEYVCIRADRTVTLKPANATFEQAAAIPVAAVTALQALRDKAKVRPGQTVLINGASGGVGTFAVQIAKSFGAVVSGVCSTRNLEMVRSLGADEVIDYTKEDFTKRGRRYDVILDCVGSQPLLPFRRALNPGGVCVLIGGGGPNEGAWIGPLARPIKALLLSPFVSEKFTMFIADTTRGELNALRDLIEAGKVTPVIDRTYPLSEIQEAIRYLEEGHARGKVIITMDDETAP